MGILALKAGRYLIKSSNLTDKVTAGVKLLLSYDTNGDKTLSSAELEAVISHLKGDDSKEARAIRTLIYFVAACHRLWDKNPSEVEKKLKRAKPFLSSWNDNWRIAKLEMMLYTYYRGGIGEKIEKLIVDAYIDETSGQMKESVFEETVGPMVEEFMEEIFGEMAAEVLLNLIF